MSVRDRLVGASRLFVTVSVLLVSSSCLVDDTGTLLAPVPEPKARLSASNGSVEGGGKSIRPVDSLAACIAVAVAEGEQEEDQGTSGAETWRRVKDDVARCRERWRMSLGS